MKVITRRGLPIVVSIGLVLIAVRAGGWEDLIYTVQAGDTPCEIAQKFGMSCTVLLEANGLGTDPVIYPGQVLTVTASGAIPTQPKPEVVPESATTAQDSTTVASVAAVEVDEPDTNDSKSNCSLSISWQGRRTPSSPRKPIGTGQRLSSYRNRKPHCGHS